MEFFTRSMVPPNVRSTAVVDVFFVTCVSFLSLCVGVVSTGLMGVFPFSSLPLPNCLGV